MTSDTEKANFCPANRLRTILCDACSGLFGFLCTENEVLFPGKYCDVSLRIGFTRGIDTQKAAHAISECNVVHNGKKVVQSAYSDNGYINIVLCDEILENIADEVIEYYPHGDVLQSTVQKEEYVTARLHIISSKNSNFAECMRKENIRKCFLTALTIPNNINAKKLVADMWLCIERESTVYDGMGKVADAIHRLMILKGD